MFFRWTTPLVEVSSVFEITEDILALLGQHVIHHVTWNMDTGFGVFIILSVRQLKRKDWGKGEKRNRGFLCHFDSNRVQVRAEAEMCFLDLVAKLPQDSIGWNLISDINHHLLWWGSTRTRMTFTCRSNSWWENEQVFKINKALCYKHASNLVKSPVWMKTEYLRVYSLHAMHDMLYVQWW